MGRKALRPGWLARACHGPIDGRDSIAPPRLITNHAPLRAQRGLADCAGSMFSGQGSRRKLPGGPLLYTTAIRHIGGQDKPHLLCASHVSQYHSALSQPAGPFIPESVPQERLSRNLGTEALGSSSPNLFARLEDLLIATVLRKSMPTTVTRLCPRQAPIPSSHIRRSTHPSLPPRGSRLHLASGLQP